MLDVLESDVTGHRVGENFFQGFTLPGIQWWHFLIPLFSVTVPVKKGAQQEIGSQEPKLNSGLNREDS